MRDIGVQIISRDIVVKVHLIPVSLLLHVDNHYTQQSTLDLFIPWSGIPVAITYGAFWVMEDKMIFSFSGKDQFVYS